jgi:hypothetical protein
VVSRESGAFTQLSAESGLRRAATRSAGLRPSLPVKTYQAPDFYRARGYESLVAVDDYPRGHRDYLLRKIL